jgi:adenylosuccinate synthase
MPVQVIVGAQWGDEGKGKIVDRIAKNVDIVARYQGGANAGHTVIVPDATTPTGERTFVFHLVPSGIFHQNVTCVIGNGVVIDPVALLTEIDQVEKAGVTIKNRLLISSSAHLILPYHKALDAVHEKGDRRIGTTGRGIGPAYHDKALREGLRAIDLLDRKQFAEKLRRNIEEKNKILTRLYEVDPMDTENIVHTYSQLDERLNDHIVDTADYLNSALKRKKKILAEGAQGALLDIDHGTYPFVTSSNPTSGGACTGLGIPPTAINSILGISKAYATRVGEGPFPTELKNAIGDKLRATGGEFGATTGRPRRCGWLDIVALNYSITVNGISKTVLTKLDVLDDFDEILVCVAYKIGGTISKQFPLDVAALNDVEPVFKHFKGWKCSTTEARTWNDLPVRARQYVKAIASMTGVPVWMVSTGARRNQTLFVK